MFRKFLFVIFCFIFIASCSSAPDGAGNSSANKTAVSNQAMPEGISANPVPTTGTTPGIPDPNTVNMNAVQKGATPTPGIPDPKEAGKPFKPGAKPTPGIPDAATLKKQLNSASNVNVNQAAPNDGTNRINVVPSDAVNKNVKNKPGKNQ